MAITTTVKVPPGVDVAGCYVRLTDIMGKKDREADPQTHYVTYGVHVEKDGVTVHLANLDRFKISDIDPSSDIMALCYADLKQRIVDLGWDAAPEDV